MRTRKCARSESRFQPWRFWGAISPGAIPRADREDRAFGAKTTTRKRFAGRPGESSLPTPHQLQSWKPGSYAAWPSLHAPKQLGPPHSGGTAETPCFPCPRRVRSFAACTYVKEARTALHRKRALDPPCRRVEFLLGSSSANPARTLVTS